MKIHFLGTNGWYDTKTGNTPSILVESKDCYVVFDAGLGIHKLTKLVKKDKPIYLFITHLHLDHIFGLHTLPLFNFAQPLTILGGPGFKKIMKFFIAHPFTATPAELKIKLNIKELKPGKYNKPLKFECLPLKHIDNTLGYRVYLEDKIITYCSDTAPCDNAVALGKEADVFIHECAFLPGETSAWGHTNPEQAGQIAQRAKPKHFFLTHFAANKYTTLASRKKAEKVAKKFFPKTIATVDDLTITI